LHVIVGTHCGAAKRRGLFPVQEVVFVHGGNFSVGVLHVYAVSVVILPLSADFHLLLVGYHGWPGCARILNLPGLL